MLLIEQRLTIFCVHCLNGWLNHPHFLHRETHIIDHELSPPKNPPKQTKNPKVKKGLQTLCYIRFYGRDIVLDRKTS